MRFLLPILLVVLLLVSQALAQTPAWVTQSRMGGGAEVTSIVQGKDEEGIYNVLTNWSQGWMEFEASATADLAEAKNAGQAEYLAKRAAKILAFREAVEFLNGVVISDALTGIDRGVLKTDVINARTSGMIKNAAVISEDCQWKVGPGGSQYPWGIVKIGILLYGDRPDNNIISLVLDDAKSGLDQSGYQPYQPPSAGTSAAAAAKPVTGVILNARGKDARPNLSPLVLVQGMEKKVVYSGASVSREYALKTGAAGYAKSQQEALANDRLSVDGVVNPLMVNVASVENNALYLTPEDAASVIAADMKDDFLDKCRVIILID